MKEEDIEKIIKDKFTNGYGFDPLTILTIISICISVYKMIKQCRAANSVLVASAKRKGLAYRVFVEKHLKNEFMKKGVNPDTADEIIEELRKKFIENE